MDATRSVIRRMLAEDVAVDDVTIHKIDDEKTTLFYFELGHGNESYDDGMEQTDPLTHEIWALVHGQVERHPQIDMGEIERAGVDVSDPEQVRIYIEDQLDRGSDLPTWTHNSVWNYLTPSVDDHWKGHFEGDTGRLSVVNPGRFKLTNQLLGVLRAEFHPTEIHVFE